MAKLWGQQGGNPAFEAVELLEKCQATAPVPLPAGLDGGIQYGLVLKTRKEDGFCDLLIRVDCTKYAQAGSGFVMSPATIRLFRNPDDRSILASLYGSCLSAMSGAREVESTIFVWGEITSALLQKLAGSGRLFMVNGEDELDEACQVGLDENPAPWSLGMKVERDGQTGMLTFSGLLQRGGETLPLDRIELIPDGWFLSGHTLSRHEVDPLWASFFVTNRRLKIGERDLQEYLLKLGGLGHRLPPCEWPDGMTPPYADEGRPVPVLELTSPYLEACEWTGKVSFQYGPWCVPQGAGAVSYCLIGRTLIARDCAVEALCGQQLADAGFSSWRSGDYVRWTIDPDKVGAALPELMQKGWRCRMIPERGDPMPIGSDPDWILQSASGVDWFDLSGIQWGGGTGLRSISAAALIDAINNRKGFVIIPGSGEAFVIPGELKRLIMVMLAWGKQEGASIKIPTEKAKLLGALMADSGSGGGTAGFLIVPEQINAFQCIQPCEPPPTFNSEFTLRNYQKEGLGWLHFLRDFRFGGCLADDMGLGKTVQVLALLEERRVEREKDKAIPASLVVVPRSLVFNWVAEAARFAPAMRVHVHAGPARCASADLFSSFDIIVTTYGLVRSDLELLRLIPFDYVILDEAHEIRNEEAQCSQAVKMLKAQHRLAITGTPVMNHPRELRSIFEFLNPGMFNVLSKLQGPLNVKGAGYGDLAMTGAILRPFILRRDKNKVALDLPSKTEQVILCDLYDEERLEYDALREIFRQTLLKRVEAEGMGPMRMHVLAALMRLRQLACHRGLIDPGKRSAGSAKLDELLERVKQVVDEGHKVLIFSQFTSLLAIVKSLFDAEGLDYAYLDGQMPAAQRTREIARFQTEPRLKCFLLSLKAGGLGLNLTAADYVFVIDPWWNPAIEQQAIDRAHRIGQTRPVFAYRLITRDTVEEKMMELHARKKGLVEALLTEENARITSLTRDDLAFMLS